MYYYRVIVCVIRNGKENREVIGRNKEWERE